MIKVAFVGWRGLVGSVLTQRLFEENNFKQFEACFFSTSSVGSSAPEIPNQKQSVLKDAFSTEELLKFDIIVSCQGSSYTKKIYPLLREKSWKGYWLDAASHLRLREESTLLLDPLNGKSIEEALLSGKKDFTGANCTVSLMLMALQGLIEEDMIEWIHSSSYQAISGAGSSAINSLLSDFYDISHIEQKKESSLSHPLLDKIDSIHKKLLEKNKGTTEQTLGTNLLPWIDQTEEFGRSLEEAKTHKESHKILSSTHSIPIDGTCVRVPVLRSHSQTLTLNLKQELSPGDLESLIKKGNKWIKLIPNTRDDSLHSLTPLRASSSLDILVGRCRKLKLPGNLYEVFTVGDQLLWGASEPLRRGLMLIIDFLEKKM